MELFHKFDRLFYTVKLVSGKFKAVRMLGIAVSLVVHPKIRADSIRVHAADHTALGKVINLLPRSAHAERNRYNLYLVVIQQADNPQRIQGSRVRGGIAGVGAYKFLYNDVIVFD